MSAETQAKWDRCCDSRIDKFVDDVLADAIVEFVCEYTHNHLKKLREEFEAKLGELRADMNVQTGIQRRQIAEINRDVA